jgi:hypothetical protein
VAGDSVRVDVGRVPFAFRIGPKSQRVAKLVREPERLLDAGRELL